MIIHHLHGRDRPRRLTLPGVMVQRDGAADASAGRWTGTSSERPGCTPANAVPPCWQVHPAHAITHTAVDSGLLSTRVYGLEVWLASPYSPGSGQMPPLIVGRDVHMSRARAALARLRTDGLPANPLVLTGPRGVGKTVLLRAVQAEALGAGHPVVYLTLDRGTSAPERLAAGLAHQMHEVLGDTGGARWRRLRDRLGELGVKLTLPGVSVERGAAPRDPSPARPPVDRDELARLVTEAAALAREHGHGGLVLVLDEFQEAPPADLVVLVNTIQDTVGQAGAVVVVAAGLPQTPDALMSAGSFAERFTYLTVGRLTDDEALLALVEPARGRGVAWSPGAMDAVLSKAHGSPYLLQLFADATWDAARPHRGQVLDPAAAASGLRITEEQLHNGMFRGRWNKAGPAERDLLIAVAASLRPDGTAAVSDVLTVTGRTPQQLSGPRQRLLDKGLLEAPARGQLAFTMPGFEDFLRIQAGLPPTNPTPLRGADDPPALPGG